MTPEAIIEECSSAGIHIYATAGKLRVEGPRGAVTAALLQAIQESKPELLEMLAVGFSSFLAEHPIPPPPDELFAEPAPEWDPETASLIRWFQAARQARTLPAELHTGQKSHILNPPRAYEILENIIAAGPEDPRVQSGGLLKDLARIRSLVEGAASQTDAAGSISPAA